MVVEARPGNPPDREYGVSRQSKLAAVVFKRHVYHWDNAFRKVHDSKDLFVDRIGVYLPDLLDFQRFLLSEQQKATKKTIQEVVILPKLTGTLELPIMINGAPILLVHPRMRFAMENLLNGISEYQDDLVSNGITVPDIKADRDFFNKWRLGLTLIEETDGDRKRYSLKIPETTKVIIGG